MGDIIRYLTMKCDTCHFYNYDDEYGDYVCDASMDEDEYARLVERGSKECPYWRDGDEYSVVKHQI